MLDNLLDWKKISFDKRVETATKKYKLHSHSHTHGHSHNVGGNHHHPEKQNDDMQNVLSSYER